MGAAEVLAAAGQAAVLLAVGGFVLVEGVRRLFVPPESLSIDVGYRYSDYGTADYDLVTDPEFDLSTHSVTAGVNFKF